MDLEHQQLILRYEHLRMRCAERERRLLSSLAGHGQQIPIVVVASEEPDRFVVVDGYKRVRALGRLGCDVVQAACWDMGEADALFLGRSMRAGVEESAFEQGLWLQELHLRFALSLDELARRFDRSVSWVSRRLALLRDLPEGIQQRVLRGEVVAHAAMKYLVPLARANREACERLVEAIADKKLSTRQVGELVAAYRSGGAKTRALVLAEPLVVLEARGEGKAPRPAMGPQSPGELLLHDLEILSSVARRALKRLCEGAALRLAPPELDDLATGFQQAQREMARLERQVQKEVHGAGPGTTDGDPGALPSWCRGTDDRQDDGPRSGNGAQGDPLRIDRGPAARAPGASAPAPREDPGSPCDLRGQPGAGA
jgi:ParB family chromosome partitioning protein